MKCQALFVWCFRFDIVGFFQMSLGELWFVAASLCFCGETLKGWALSQENEFVPCDEILQYF
ncbi:MAG: hypothetical protein CSB34_07250 [Desulfobulbus propionicus]|nr:MAG: hypothetical protein CSB34_07250 [Desulfobulbus propionicus]PIE66516.1 MAG: hypothetical protein CSA26_00555 [Desulfobacterales bacterium]